MPDTAIASGWHYLTADVPNPKPDRRSKRYDSLPVWVKGTRVFIKLPNQQYRGWVEWPDGSTSYFGNSTGNADFDKDYTQANAVLDNIVAAGRETAGRFFKKAYIRPEQAIARLIDLGIVTFANLRTVEAELKEWDDSLLADFDKEHEI